MTANRRVLAPVLVLLTAVVLVTGCSTPDASVQVTPTGASVPAVEFDTRIAEASATFDKATEGKSVAIAGQSRQPDTGEEGIVSGVLNADGSSMDVSIEGRDGEGATVSIKEACENINSNCLMRSSMLLATPADAWTPTEQSMLPRVYTQPVADVTAFMSNGMSRTEDTTFAIDESTTDGTDGASESVTTFTAVMDDTIRVFTFTPTTFTFTMTALDGSPISEYSHTILAEPVPYVAPSPIADPAPAVSESAAPSPDASTSAVPSVSAVPSPSVSPAP